MASASSSSSSSAAAKGGGGEGGGGGGGGGGAGDDGGGGGGAGGGAGGGGGGAGGGAGGDGGAALFKSTAILVVNDKSAAVLAARKGANVVQGYVARDDIGVVNLYRPDCSDVPFENREVQTLVNFTKINYERVQQKYLIRLSSSRSLTGNEPSAAAAAPAATPGSAGVYTHNKNGTGFLEQLLNESTENFECKGQAVFRDVDLLDQDALYQGRFQIREDVTNWFAHPKNQCSAVTMLIRKELRHSPGFMSLIEGLGIRFFTKSAARNVDTVVVFRDAPTFLGAELPLFVEKLVALSCDGEGMTFPVRLNVVNAVSQAQLADSAGSSPDRVSIWINDDDSDDDSDVDIVLKNKIIDCFLDPKPELQHIYLKKTKVFTGAVHFILRVDIVDEDLDVLPLQLFKLHQSPFLECEKYGVHNGIFIEGNGCVLMEKNKGFEAPSVYSCLATPPQSAGEAAEDPVKKFYVECHNLGLDADQIQDILLAEKALGDAEQAGLVVRMNDLLQLKLEAGAGAGGAAAGAAAGGAGGAGGAAEAGGQNPKRPKREIQLNRQCETLINKLKKKLPWINAANNSTEICKKLTFSNGKRYEAMLIKTAGRVYISEAKLCTLMPLVEVSQEGIYAFPTSLPTNFLDVLEPIFGTLEEILEENKEIFRQNSAALRLQVRKVQAAGAARAKAEEEEEAIPQAEINAIKNDNEKRINSVANRRAKAQEAAAGGGAGGGAGGAAEGGGAALAASAERAAGGGAAASAEAAAGGGAREVSLLSSMQGIIDTICKENIRSSKLQGNFCLEENILIADQLKDLFLRQSRSEEHVRDRINALIESLIEKLKNPSGAILQNFLRVNGNQYEFLKWCLLQKYGGGGGGAGAAAASRGGGGAGGGGNSNRRTRKYRPRKTRKRNQRNRKTRKN